LAIYLILGGNASYAQRSQNGGPIKYFWRFIFSDRASHRENFVANLIGKMSAARFASMPRTIIHWPDMAAAAHLFNPRGANADREISTVSNFFCTTVLFEM
jgi:hypothetical protein